MFEPVVPEVARLGVVFVNVFALGEPRGPWVLVDTGLLGSAGFIRRAVARRFGEGARPEAILLSYGHFDHAGSAHKLASGWGFPSTPTRSRPRTSPAGRTTRRATRPWAARWRRCPA